MEAIQDDTNKISLIMDGMAQIHTEIPWCGNCYSFPKKCTQHLQGVYEHGRCIHIFRTFENVKYDANLGIYALLTAIVLIYFGS